MIADTTLATGDLRVMMMREWNHRLGARQKTNKYSFTYTRVQVVHLTYPRTAAPAGCVVCDADEAVEPHKHEIVLTCGSQPFPLGQSQRIAYDMIPSQ